MYKAIVFAGTTEGYELCRFLAGHGIQTCACVATEYGAKSLEEDSFLTVHTGRLDAEEMTKFFCEEKPEVVIDATHPYAAQVTENLRKSSEVAGVEYIRVLRESTGSRDSVVYVEDVQGAAAFLADTTGNVMLTTGSKELAAFTAVPDYRKRLFARVLSLPSVAKSCAELGFEGRNLICMQGPFSKDLNAAMLRQYDCKYLVTKDTGSAGGFEEKLLAAEECDVTAVVIGRPLQEKGISVKECRRVLAENFGFSLKPRVSLVGIGMGTEKTLTLEAKQVLKEAELVIGAKRMVEAVCVPGQEIFCEYRSEVIADYIRNHPEYVRIAIALSGDVGFYSGAKKLIDLLGMDTEVVCGISSVAYFMGKIGLSWEDAYLVSAHGRDGNLISAIREHEKVFAILGTGDGVRKLASRLVFYGMGKVKLYVGENLSYSNELIFGKNASELTENEGDSLCVVCAVNPEFVPRKATHGICDEAFLRAKVPMTKEEIRCVSLEKLGLYPDSVCYDIGAGTGSVSIEMALRANKGHVYAIEKKEEAVELLRENKRKFCADNLEIISATAPEGLEKLPVPSHAFIGGSSGNLKDIVQVLFEKNPDIRLVINCITLETVSEALEVLKTYPDMESEIVQMNVSRSRQAGRYHMMMGENPVFIITIAKKRGL